MTCSAASSGPRGSRYSKVVVRAKSWARYQEGMEDLGAGRQLEGAGDLGAGLLGLEADHLAGVGVAALGDLVADVAHLEQGRLGLDLGDIAAAALDPGDPALGGQLPERPVGGHAADAERPVGGHAADAERAGQLVLRRQARALGPVAGQDAADDVVLDLAVERRVGPALADGHGVLLDGGGHLYRQLGKLRPVPG
jgi:hypothetical protein